MNTTITASKENIIAPYLFTIAKYQRLYQEEKAKSEWLRDQLTSLQLSVQDEISRIDHKIKGE